MPQVSAHFTHLHPFKQPEKEKLAVEIEKNAPWKNFSSAASFSGLGCLTG